MTLKWAKSEGIRQDDADNRRKLPTETYTQYCIEKKHLCRMAYPDAAESTIIVKIRSKLDREASHFCREKRNLERFLDEMIDYDESIGLFNSNNVIQEKPNRRREQQNVGNTQPNNPTRLAITSGSSSESGRQDPHQRRLTIKDRMNPETGKMTKSFTDRNGKTIFIDRPCDKCTIKGRTEWHFRFECPYDPGLKAYLLQLREEDEGQIDGLSISPSGGQTSYTFRGNPYAYAAKLARFDDGYSSDESGKDGGAQ